MSAAWHSATMTRFLLGRQVTVVRVLPSKSHFFVVEHINGDNEAHFITPEEYRSVAVQMFRNDGFENHQEGHVDEG